MLERDSRRSLPKWWWEGFHVFFSAEVLFLYIMLMIPVGEGFEAFDPQKGGGRDSERAARAPATDCASALSSLSRSSLPSPPPPPSSFCLLARLLPPLSPTALSRLHPPPPIPSPSSSCPCVCEKRWGGAGGGFQIHAVETGRDWSRLVETVRDWIETGRDSLCLGLGV